MSTCQANPLTQFVTKNDQQPRLIHRLVHDNGDHQNQRRIHVNAPEEVFLCGQDAAAGNRFMGAMPSVAAVKQEEQQAFNASPSWLSQFHSMKLDDPLEFSQEYKNMYNAYEKPAGHRVRLPMATYRPVTYSMPSKEVPSGDTQDLFAAEFETLEKELEDVESKTRRPVFDQEQREFQKIASEISESCSSSQSTKLKNSKFMGLMKSISEGSVTLNRQDSQHATELHSPCTGKRVGNEFFSIKDCTLY